MSDETTSLSDEQKAQKIQSLREMITSAESTIHSAKAMLLQFEGKKKAGRKKKIVDDGDGQVVQGTFDGQIMVGTDGKQYPVPANYASKSKLVEGDLLKLTISPEGFFIYKQIGPVPRQNKIGIMTQDQAGNYVVQAEGKIYRILLASATYFKAEPGDEVVIVTGQQDDCLWASIESVLQHNHMPQETAPVTTSLPPEPTPSTAAGMLTGRDSGVSAFSDIEPTQEHPIAEPQEQMHTTDTFLADQSQPMIQADPMEELVTQTQEAIQKSDNTQQADPTQSIINEWTPDIDEIEKEIREEMGIKQST